MTTSVNCKAKNPEFCRYHGSSRRSAFENRVLYGVNTLKEELSTTTNLARREELEQQLREAEIDYAATVAGEADLTERLENADWTEKERLEAVLRAGTALRERVEASEEDGSTTFVASKLGEAIKRIETANRRLARAQIDERFTYTVEEFIEEDEQGHKYQMVKLTLSHPTIAENGWSFIAAVDKAENGELLTRTLPNQELHGYRPQHFECEHCHSNRRRKATYLVRNEEGEYKQVGSNCLAPFLGVQPKGLWALSYDLEDKGDVIDRGERRYGGPDTIIPTEDTVAIALAVSDGGNKYISSTYANNSGLNSTSQEVRKFLFGGSGSHSNLDYEPYREQARKMIQETQFNTGSDYDTNMRSLMNQRNISPKHIGYVTSVIAANQRVQRQAERAAAQAAIVPSVGYLAPVGEKVTGISAKVKKIIPFTSDYSYTSKAGRKIIMTTPEGQEITWSTTGNADAIWDVKEGSDILVERATIKAHRKYNENDQTDVKNAKISIVEAVKI